LERSAFESMPAAFPITREVIVAALATDVVTSSVPCGLQVIKGTSDAVIEDFLAAHEHARAVAFRKIDLSESKWDRSRASGPWAETGPDS
jgi:hypothetical protein